MSDEKKKSNENLPMADMVKPDVQLPQQKRILKVKTILSSNKEEFDVSVEAFLNKNNNAASVQYRLAHDSKTGKNIHAAFIIQEAWVTMQ